MKKREENKTRNRALLVEAGRAVFAKKGFRAARITDITTAAGLAAGTFYKYFEDKRDLFLFIVGELTPTFRKRLREARAFEENEAPEAWVRRGIAAFLDIVQEYPELVRLFLIREFSQNEKFAEVFRQVRAGYEKDLVGDLQRLIEAGTIPPIEAELVTHTIIASIVSLAIEFLEDPEKLREPVLNTLTHMIMGGFREMIRHSEKRRKAESAGGA